MSLLESLNKIAEKIVKQEASISTEEATKTGFVMPFLSALGYDVFDPEEVIPEFTADIGNKKGLKVDYAIKVNDKILMIIECKMLNTKLDALKEAQLHWYFHNTESRISILTDGVIYKFYSDLDNPNKMDEKPFFEFSILQIDDSILKNLKSFTKKYFNPNKKYKYTLNDSIFSAAENKSKTEKFLTCLRLAEQGDVNAQYEIGLMYQMGEEVNRNYTSAIEWYKKAAAQNHINAQLNLGRIFYSTPDYRNYAGAIIWFNKAAEQGHTEAIAWLEKEAKQGNTEAQLYLGKMYQSGQGVERDLKLAEHWYLKAIENGDSDMQKRVITACLYN